MITKSTVLHSEFVVKSGLRTKKKNWKLKISEEKINFSRNK